MRTTRTAAVIAALMLAAVAADAWGQNSSSEPGTLPPVDVLPPALTDPGNTDMPVEPLPLGGQPQADGEAQSDFSGNDFQPNDFDPSPAAGQADSLGNRLRSYPSLFDQTVGDLSGGGRLDASVFEATQFATVLGPQQIRERAPATVADALADTPGVLIQRTGRGQASPFIRGLTGQQVLILVDGVRLNSATFRVGPNQYLNTIDPGTIERIEVVTGPGSLQYGSDALGGVINIVTRRASPERSPGAFQPGTLQRYSTADSGYYGRVTGQVWQGNGGLYAGATYGNFHDIDRGGNLGRQPDTSFNLTAGDVSWSRWLDDFTFLEVSLQHFEAEDVFRTDRFPANRLTVFDPQQRNLALVRLSGEVSESWADIYVVSAAYQRTVEGRFDRNPRNNPLADQRNFDNDQASFSLTLKKDLGGWGIVRYGLDWVHEDVDASRVRIDETTDPVTVTPSSATQFPDDAFYSRYGGYLDWDVRLSERLFARAGFRYELDEAGATVTAGGSTGRIGPEYNDWIASASLVYELSPCVRFIGGFHEGFRAPNLDDLAATNDNIFAGVELPNPSLQPEQLRTYEVGLKIDTQRVRAQAFIWWSDLDNFIGRAITNPGPNQLLERENRAAELSGVEFAGELLLERGWSVYGNVTYTEGWDLVLNEPLSRIPPLNGQLGVRYRSRDAGYWIDLFVWAYARQDKLSTRDLTDTIRIPPGGTPGFATLNLRAGMPLGPEERMSLVLENLTDEAYRIHGSGADGTGFNAVFAYEFYR